MYSFVCSSLLLNSLPLKNQLRISLTVLKRESIGCKFSVLFCFSKCIYIVLYCSQLYINYNKMGRYITEVYEQFYGMSVNPLTGIEEPIYEVVMINSTDMLVKVITYGATITEIYVPDQFGNYNNVVMGFDNIEGYRNHNAYFGATIGRVCNRIDRSNFWMNGKRHRLDKNENENSLHGGFLGFDKMHWEILSLNALGVTFRHVSPNGWGGYPGELTTTVRYSLTNDNALHIEMNAQTTEATVVNMTNHSYFNLAGHGAGKAEVYKHWIRIAAKHVLETDKEGIPTGRLVNLTGSKYNLNDEKLIREAIDDLGEVGGFDDSYCVMGRNSTISYIAEAFHPDSGRSMEVFSNQPNLQFYTANHLPDIEKGEEPIYGTRGEKYGKHGAFCLETQGYPDAMHHGNFPFIGLHPAEVYNSLTIYKFHTPGTRVPREHLPHSTLVTSTEPKETLVYEKVDDEPPKSKSKKGGKPEKKSAAQSMRNLPEEREGRASSQLVQLRNVAPLPNQESSDFYTVNLPGKKKVGFRQMLNMDRKQQAKNTPPKKTGPELQMLFRPYQREFVDPRELPLSHPYNMALAEQYKRMRAALAQDVAERPPTLGGSTSSCNIPPTAPPLPVSPPLPISPTETVSATESISLPETVSPLLPTSPTETVSETEIVSEMEIVSPTEIASTSMQAESRRTIAPPVAASPIETEIPSTSKQAKSGRIVAVPLEATTDEASTSKQAETTRRTTSPLVTLTTDPAKQAELRKMMTTPLSEMTTEDVIKEMIEFAHAIELPSTSRAATILAALAPRRIDPFAPTHPGQSTGDVSRMSVREQWRREPFVPTSEELRQANMSEEYPTLCKEHAETTKTPTGPRIIIPSNLKKKFMNSTRIPEVPTIPEEPAVFNRSVYSEELSDSDLDQYHELSSEQTVSRDSDGNTKGSSGYSHFGRVPLMRHAKQLISAASSQFSSSNTISSLPIDDMAPIVRPGSSQSSHSLASAPYRGLSGTLSAATSMTSISDLDNSSFTHRSLSSLIDFSDPTKRGPSAADTEDEAEPKSNMETDTTNEPEGKMESEANPLGSQMSIVEGTAEASSHSTQSESATKMETETAAESASPTLAATTVSAETASENKMETEAAVEATSQMETEVAAETVTQTSSATSNLTETEDEANMETETVSSPIIINVTESSPTLPESP